MTSARLKVIDDVAKGFDTAGVAVYVELHCLLQRVRDLASLVQTPSFVRHLTQFSDRLV